MCGKDCSPASVSHEQAPGQSSDSLQRAADHHHHLLPKPAAPQVTKGATVIRITVSMFARALAVMLQSLGLDPVLYSLHSIRRVGGGGVQKLHTGLGYINWI